MFCNGIDAGMDEMAEEFFWLIEQGKIYGRIREIWKYFMEK